MVELHLSGIKNHILAAFPANDGVLRNILTLLRKVPFLVHKNKVPFIVPEKKVACTALST